MAGGTILASTRLTTGRLRTVKWKMALSANVYLLPGLGDGAQGRSRTYEEYLISIGLAVKTVHTYRNRLDMAERFLSEIGVSLLQADAFQLSAMASSTANSHSMRGQLRCALKHWFEWQDRMNAPLRAVRVPPQPRMVCQALEADEARALVDTARGWWPHGAAVLLGLFLALRREEIAKAEWERFDDKLEWYTVTGKNDKTATIPVHPIVTDEFERHRGDGWLFPGRKNVRAYVNPTTVWEWTKVVAREAGIGEVRTHQLRHTALTTALDNTENLRAVMEFARHERPQTTAGYTRTTAVQLRRVSDALAY